MKPRQFTVEALLFLANGFKIDKRLALIPLNL